METFGSALNVLRGIILTKKKRLVWNAMLSFAQNALLLTNAMPVFGPMTPQETRRNAETSSKNA